MTGNYLRVRGEYRRSLQRMFWAGELPPRARRIQKIAPGAKTGGVNYLRVRGEYLIVSHICSKLQELPPRARRIRSLFHVVCCPGGTTSACAENTPGCGDGWGGRWNYLRVRGEYDDELIKVQVKQELPPRARRILINNQLRLIHIGTTSACAENTLRCQRHPVRNWNYLRVRGEYRLFWAENFFFLELPPRARRILCHSSS